MLVDPSFSVKTEAESVQTKKTDTLEVRVQSWIQSFPVLKGPSLLLKNILRDEFLVLLLYILAWLIESLVFIELSFILGINLILNGIAKWIHQYPRPSWVEDHVVNIEHGFEPDYSTPSGHNQAVMAIAVFISVKFPHPAVITLMVLLVLLTGVSRIYLGVHYIHDVLYGWALGVILPLVFHFFRVGEMFLGAGLGYQIASVFVLPVVEYGVLYLIRTCVPDRSDAEKKEWTNHAQLQLINPNEQIEIKRRAFRVYNFTILSAVGGLVGLILTIQFSGYYPYLQTRANVNRMLVGCSLYFPLVVLYKKTTTETKKCVLALILGFWVQVVFLLYDQCEYNLNTNGYLDCPSKSYKELETGRLELAKDWDNYLHRLISSSYDTDCFNYTSLVGNITHYFAEDGYAIMDHLGKYTGHQDISEYFAISIPTNNQNFWRTHGEALNRKIRFIDRYTLQTESLVRFGFFNDSVYEDPILKSTLTYASDSCRPQFKGMRFISDGLQSMSYLPVMMYQGFGFGFLTTNKTCDLHETFCLGSNQQFASHGECVQFQDSLPRMSQACGLRGVAMGKSRLCKYKHALLSPHDPDLHCSHIGRGIVPDMHGHFKCSDTEDCVEGKLYPPLDPSWLDLPVDLTTKRFGLDLRPLVKICQ